MQLEPRLVVAGLQSAVVAENLVDDCEHVVGSGAVVGRGVTAATACTADSAVVLKKKYLNNIPRIVIYWWTELVG